MITPSQCRAARGLIDLSQSQLAEAARVGLSTVRNFEAGRSIPVTNNIDAIVSAFTKAGVEFIPENGGGAGVRLRKSQATGDHPKPVGPATDAVERMDGDIAKDRAKRKR